MRGSKAVSDLMSDAKYSAADKRAAWILSCDDEQIQAVRAFFPEDDIKANVARMKHAILLTSQE